MTLYRPVGLKELELIAESGFQAFPPRLYWQPIFYPVLNFPYAEHIAKEWNTKDPASGFCGFVTRFEVDSDYLQQYPVKIVGSAEVHQELWIPAEQLSEFNRHLIGRIEVEAAYYGERFQEEIDPETNLPGSIRSVDG